MLDHFTVTYYFTAVFTVLCMSTVCTWAQGWIPLSIYSWYFSRVVLSFDLVFPPVLTSQYTPFSLLLRDS